MAKIRKEYIFREQPNHQCHASTLVLLEGDGAIAAWFGGTREGAQDVRIHYSIRQEGKWSRPAVIEDGGPGPHWNPVLFEDGEGTLHLYYKTGHPIGQWKTMETQSRDRGRSWSAPRELVSGDSSGGRGPVKNKPLLLPEGRVLAPASTEQDKWRCFADIFDGSGWRKSFIPVDASEEESLSIIQPTFWEGKDGMIHALMRTDAGRIYRSDSPDRGESWCAAYPTDMPNNNSGIDCVMTPRGLLLVCNPVEQNWGPRSPLSLFLSSDEGRTFRHLADLETRQGEFSYPSIVCSGSRVCLTYTCQRRQIVFCTVEL